MGLRKQSSSDYYNSSSYFWKFDRNKIAGNLVIALMVISLAVLFQTVGTANATIHQDDFNNSSLDPSWTSNTDSGISFDETGGKATFTKSSGGSNWDYGYIERAISKSTGFRIYTDVDFDFRSLSFDGMGQAAIQIVNSDKTKSVVYMRLRDYQASSTGYEPRIFAYDSSGSKIYDNALGYQSSQSGSGYFQIIWEDSDSVRVTLKYPDGIYSTTIHGVNTDVGYVRLNGGVHATYSGSHTYSKFDNYEETIQENFNDGTLDPIWTSNTDSGISFDEFGGKATFTQGSGGSNWDYGYIERAISRSTGLKIQADVDFDFRSLSYDGIGQAQIQIVNSQKDKTVVSLRLRDYQASSTGYEPRIFAYDSSGSKIYDNALGYQSSQSGSGYFQIIWEDSDSVRVTLKYPDGIYSTTIHGVNTDVGYVRLNGGVHATYSGSHTYIKFDNYEESFVNYYDDNDYVRKHLSTKTSDVALEVFEYAATNYPSDFSGEIDTIEEKIIAIDHFAEDILAYFWGSDNDALTAGEVAQEFANFDGATDDKDSFSLVSRSTIDCRDMAAFISGIAFVTGLSSRMVSVSDVTETQFIDDYQHFFTEIYGLDANGNNKWFLIDPARDSQGSYLNSYSSDTTIQWAYGGSDQQLSRLWISSGWTSYGWGSGLTEMQTGWQYQYFPTDPSPPVYSTYSNNPWGL